MTRLSVNINKVATLRNARGGNTPDVQQMAIDCQRFGAEGITVHPRPDERHIRYSDVRRLRNVVDTELNIEGYPSEPFLDLVTEVGADQVTLVPDPPDVLTSNAGWDTITHKDMLKEVIARLKEKGIRTSIFMETDLKRIEHAVETGADRVELYTESYARNYLEDPEKAVRPFVDAAAKAHEVGLGINAGHDLDRDNLSYFVARIPHILEVSIGHALIADALYYGMENTIQLYRRAIADGMKER